MNIKTFALAASVATMAVASPAMAAPHFSTAGQAVNVVGIGDISGTECVASITGVVGPSLGLAAPHADHSDRIIATIINTGDGACPFVTFDAVLFADGSLDLSGNAVINGICGVAGVPVSYPASTVAISAGTNVSTSLTYGGCNLSLWASDPSLGFHP